MARPLLTPNRKEILMAKEKTPITINDKEYLIEDMTEQQQVIINHVADLDRKIRSSEFNLDQLRIGREAFVNMLTASLEETEE
jgi:hypothetical protein